MSAATQPELAPVPGWVTDGWYSNNPGAQKVAVERYRMPVTTATERAAVASYAISQSEISTFACTGCGKFAFDKPVLCFWCRRRS